MHLKITTGAVLLCAVASLCSGQIARAEDGEQVPDEAIEEITVYGERNIIALGRDVRVAEDNFYELYNALASRDEFRIECLSVFRAGLQRNQRVCMTKFARKEQARATGDMVIADRWYEFTPNHARMRQKEEIVRQEITEFLSENLALREAFNDFAKARRDLDAEMRRRSGKRDK